MASEAPFRISRPSRLTPDMRVLAVKGTKMACCGPRSRCRRPYTLFGQDHDRPTFRSFVGERGQLCRVRHLPVGSSTERNELDGLTIPERDRAGLVQEQGVHVARRFDRPAGHREHVVLHHPVHARDADRREQATDGRRDQADEQGHQNEHCLRRTGIHRQGLERDHGHEEDDRETGEKDVERDLVRRLLTSGALDQRDHAIEERLSRVCGDPHLDPV